jgi:hypothetical protein
MVDITIFWNNVSIWDLRKTKRVMIGSGTCIDPFLIMIYVTSRAYTCIVVLIESMFKTF